MPVPSRLRFPSDLFLRGGVAALMLTSAACDGEPDGPLLAPETTEALVVSLEASVADAKVGQTILVELGVEADDGRRSGDPLVGGLQGRLTWDPTRFEFVGQLPVEETVALLGPEVEEGALPLLTVEPEGRLGAFAAIGFRALTDGATTGFGFEIEHLVAPDGSPLQAEGPLGVSVAPPAASLVLDAVRPMGVGEWLDVLAPGRLDDVSGRPMRIPGEGTIFGDVNLDLAIDVLDVLFLANASVGNEEIIIGTNSPSIDAVLAANVRPANLPGLGGLGDACAPGLDSCGSAARTLNVIDVLAVARESVGLDEDVVGEAIPRTSSADSVVLEANVSISRTLSADTIYLLTGETVVEDGGVLVIEAGTTLAADQGGLLRIAPTGSIDAQGTSLNPIVMTCRTSPAERGCWSGLIVQGNAPLNRGAVGTSGCLEATDDPREGSYGGCDVSDDRGSLEHVRIEFATRGVELLGVGSGTMIDQLQVHGSVTSGLTVAGGAADVQRLLVTATGGNALRWRDGWVGRAQHVLLQLDPNGGYSAIFGQNQAGNPTATPVSRPTLYNVTVAAIALGSTTGAAVELQDGSGLELHNLLSLSTPTGLSIDGAATCALLGSDIVVRSSVFAGAGDLGDPDADPGCAGSPMTEEIHLLDGANSNTVVTNTAEVAMLLKGGLDPFIPDFRGTNEGAAGSLTGDVPPSDGFFDVSSNYLGGVPIASLATPNIPWYSGWTRGGVESDAAFGAIEGSVIYAADGFPVTDALVYSTNGDIATATRPTGGFTLEFVHPGNTTVLVGGLAAGCSADPAAVFVTAGAAATVLPIEVTCGGGPVNQAPTADAGGPYNGTEAVSLTFDGSASSDSDGTIVRYDWDFGDGTTAPNAGPSPAHTYAAPGSYPITLTVTDDGGLTDVGQTTATIAMAPANGNIIGRWVDASGSPITSASVGEQVEFQLCTSIEDMNAFQARMSGFAALATNVSSDDLDATGSGVHPLCQGTTDLLDSFFTASGSSDPLTAQIVSLSSTGGEGPQGIFRYVFDLDASGVLTLDLADLTVSTTSGAVPTLVTDLQTLTVN